MICTKYDIQAKNCILRIQNDLPHNDNAMMYTKWKNEKIEYNKQKSARIEISKNLKKKQWYPQDKTIQNNQHNMQNNYPGKARLNSNDVFRIL